METAGSPLSRLTSLIYRIIDHNKRKSMGVIAPYYVFSRSNIQILAHVVSRQPNDKWRQSARSYNPEIAATWPVS